MKHIDILMNAVLQQSGLNLTKNQIKVLQLINIGVKNQSELSVFTERNKSSLSRIIQSLVKKGLVNKELQRNDKRQQTVELTDKGREKLHEAVPVLEANLQKIEIEIDKNELIQMIDTRWMTMKISWIQMI